MCAVAAWSKWGEMCSGKESPAQGLRGAGEGGARGGAERTSNIPDMLVTLDVSKLSG